MDMDYNLDIAFTIICLEQYIGIEIEQESKFGYSLKHVLREELEGIVHYFSIKEYSEHYDRIDEEMLNAINMPLNNAEVERMFSGNIRIGNVIHY